MERRRRRAAAMAMGGRGEERDYEKLLPTSNPKRETEKCAVRRQVRRAGPYAGLTGGTSGAAGPPAELPISAEKLSVKEC